MPPPGRFAASAWHFASAKQTPFRLATPSAVVDAASGKLLVVTKNGANGNKPALFRCNRDGSSCAYIDLSAGQGAGSGSNPSAVIDATHAKLLAVTNNAASSGRPALFDVCLQ